MRTCLGSLVITVSPAPFSKWNLPNQRLQKSSRSLLTSSLPLQGTEINSQITSLLPVLIKQTNKKLVGSVRKEALGQSERYRLYQYVDTLFSLNLLGVRPIERLNSRIEGLSLGYFIVFTEESLQLGTLYIVELIIKEEELFGGSYI